MTNAYHSVGRDFAQSRVLFALLRTRSVLYFLSRVVAPRGGELVTYDLSRHVFHGLVVLCLLPWSSVTDQSVRLFFLEAGSIRTQVQ